MQESKLDSQAVEILGKNKLINELLKAGLEVASPIRDRGIDLIAYIDIDIDKGNQLQPFVACPLQMKAATERRFSIDRKYEKFSKLLLVFVWEVGDPNSNIIYALTYHEAVEVGKEMRWTITDSWQEGHYYNTNKPGKKLLILLEKYQMTSEKWWDKVKNTGVSFI